MSKIKLKNKCNKKIGGMHIEEQFKDGTIFASTDSDNAYREDWILFEETRKQKRIRKLKNKK